MIDRFLLLKNGYRFDRLIFRTLIGLIVFLAAVCVIGYGLEPQVYYYCPNDTVGYCANPFLDPVGNCLVEEEVLCDADAFPPGFEWGNKPGWLYTNATLFFTLLIVGAFLLNHFKHNKRFAR